MDFYESISEALFARIEQGGEGKTLESQLIESPAYAEAYRTFEIILEDLPDKESAGAVKAAAFKLFDLYTHYYYRVGLQDGARLMSNDFPTKGIG